MAEKLGTAVLDLKTSNQGLTAGIHAAKTQATGLGQTFGVTSLAGVAMGAAVGAALLKAGQAVIEFGRESAQMATEFESSMNSIIALVGVAESQVNEWSTAILDLAPSLRTAPQELADAMFFITSAGLRGETAMDALTVSAQAAASGLGDITQVADAVTSAMNAYGWETVSAEQATDVLVATVREGKLEASELAGVIGRLTPLAAEMGVEFHEVGGILAALTRVGFSAAEASTSLQAIMSELLKPTTEAEAALAAVGMSAEGLRQAVVDDGLTATLQDLYEVLGRDSVALSEVFANTRALRGVLPLVGVQADSVTGIMDSLADAAGATAQAFEDTADTMESRMAAATAGLDAEMVALGDTIGAISGPVSVFLKETLTGLLDIINKPFERRRELLGNKTFLEEIVGGGAADLSELERAVELQQENIEATAAALMTARAMYTGIAEYYGTSHVLAVRQREEVTETTRALQLQEAVMVDLWPRYEEALELSKLATEEAEAQAAAAEDLSDKVHGVGAAWREVAKAVESVGTVKGDVGRGAFGTAAVDKFATAALDLTGFSDALMLAYDSVNDFTFTIHSETNKMVGSLKRDHSDIIGDWSKHLGELKDVFVEEIVGMTGAADQFGEGYGGYGTGFSPLQPNPGGINPDLGGGFEAGLVGFASALLAATGSVESLALVLDPLTTIATMLFEVLAPVINTVLAPVLNAFQLLAKSLAAYVLPMFQILGPLLEIFAGIIAALAPWFHALGEVIENAMPVLKAFFTPIAILGAVFQWLGTIIGNLGRFISNVVDRPLRPGTWSDGMVSADLNAMISGAVRNLWDDTALPGMGEIETGDIDLGDTGGGGGTGATFVQQRPIEVTVNVYDNEVYGGSLQEFGLLIRDELMAIDELGL